MKRKNKKVKQPKQKIDKQLPEFINQFLKYQTIKNLSKNTAKAYETDLYFFCEWLKEYKKIDEITVDSFDNLTLQDTIEWRSSLTNEASTVARKISSIRALLRYLKDDTREITNDLAERITSPKLPEKVPLTLNEETTTKFIDKVFEIGNEYEQAIIMMLFNTGMRADEICNLNLEDIRKDEIFVRGAKGKKDRIHVANSETLKVINNWIKVRPKTSDNALFVIDQFKTKEPYRATYTSIKYMIYKYGKILKIKDMHPHACRHTWATLLLDKGISIRTIQQGLGHKYLSTTERYAKYTTEQLRNAVNKVVIGGSRG